MESIKIHSMTDLITNSSTVIYTYSDRSKPVFEELINEILSLLGSDKKCPDVFSVVVMFAEFEVYCCWVDLHPDEVPVEFIEDNRAGNKFEALLNDISSCKVERPEWFVEMEKKIVERYRYDYSPDTTLYVSAKDPKFENLAKLVVKFLYSTDHEATRD